MSGTETFPKEKDLAFFKELIEEETTVEVPDEYTAPADITSLYQAVQTVRGVPHEITLRMYGEASDAARIELQLASMAIPGVLKVRCWYYDAEQELGFMTYDASALSTLATEAARLPAHRVLRILCLVGETLVALHDIGVAHNSVCAENIFIKNGDPLLTGFCYAQRVDKSGKATGPFDDDTDRFKELIKWQCDRVETPRNKRKIAALLELKTLEKVVSQFSTVMKYYNSNSTTSGKKKKKERQQGVREKAPITIIRLGEHESDSETESELKEYPQQQPPLRQQQRQQQQEEEEEGEERRHKEEHQSPRVPGKRLLLEDIATMTMGSGSTFADGEVCGVPRSSGGFVYATVESTVLRHECGWDKTQHDSAFCRVSYAGENGKPLFKDVPVGVLAKLLPDVPAQPPSHGTVPAAVAQHVVFSKAAKFTSGELVAVCRGSARGLRCGVVVSAAPYPCESGLHKTSGWTVIVGKGSEVRLPTIAIGKAGQQLFRGMKETVEEEGCADGTASDGKVVPEEPRKGVVVPLGSAAESRGNQRDRELAPAARQSATPATVGELRRELLQPAPQPAGAGTSSSENTAGGASPSDENAARPLLKEDPGRTIVIDGANVAAEAGRTNYSIKGLLNCIAYYKSRNYDVVVVIPKWFTRDNAAKTPRQGFSYEIVNRELLSQCLSECTVTPDGGYDDSYALQVTFNSDGCIVSNDKYRDTTVVPPAWIQKRRIGFSFLPNLTYDFLKMRLIKQMNE